MPSTPGFQPLIVPSNVAKMKRDRPDLPFSVTVKSVAFGLMFPTVPARCAKGPRLAAWCRRYCHKEWNLLTSSIESGEPGAIVTDPERTARKCSETPGVDQVSFVSSRRHSRLIRY